jgi:hypothetical protein
VSLLPNVANPSFDHEPAYAGLTLPDAGFQLLGLYRFWNIVQYWYPNREIVGENWNGVLGDSIAGIALAKTAADYKRQLLALIARVHDTHANLWSSLDSRPPVGACQLPVTLRFVGDRPVVVDGGAGLERGDVVTTLDGVAVTGLIRDWSPCTPRRNDPAAPRHRAVHDARRMLGGQRRVERLGRPMTLEATRVAPQRQTGPVTHDQPGETFRKLGDGRWRTEAVEHQGRRPARLPRGRRVGEGLVIDIRNYPSEFVVLRSATCSPATPLRSALHGRRSRQSWCVQWGPRSLTPERATLLARSSCWWTRSH